MYLRLIVIVGSGIRLSLRVLFASTAAKNHGIFVFFSLGKSAEKSALSLGDLERADYKRKEKPSGTICELPPPPTGWVTPSPHALAQAVLGSQRRLEAEGRLVSADMRASIWCFIMQKEKAG